MPLTTEDEIWDFFQPSSCGKTSPGSSTLQTMPLDAFWRRWPEMTHHWSLQGEDGQTQVLCVDPGVPLHGACKMPNTTAWPNDAAVCSLWQVLEKDSVPSRFFLSSTVCAGILRRSENRGKELPPMLRRALEASIATGKVAHTQPLTEEG